MVLRRNLQLLKDAVVGVGSGNGALFWYEFICTHRRGHVDVVCMYVINTQRAEKYTLSAVDGTLFGAVTQFHANYASKLFTGAAKWRSMPAQGVPAQTQRWWDSVKPEHSELSHSTNRSIQNWESFSWEIYMNTKAYLMLLKCLNNNFTYCALHLRQYQNKNIDKKDPWHT